MELEEATRARERDESAVEVVGGERGRYGCLARLSWVEMLDGGGQLGEAGGRGVRRQELR